MAENRKSKERRYYFTLAQLVLLGGGFALVAGVVFFLGMLVGQEIESRKIVRPEEPLVKVPIKPPGGGAAGTAKEELTFYDTLRKTPAEPPADRNRERANGKTEAKPRKPDGKEESAGGRSIENKAPGRNAAAQNGRDTGERKQAERPWTVQVNAYPDETSAKQLVDRLKNKGYNAVVTEFQTNGKTWYRVRVGRYATREEADKAADLLKSRENLTQAFAASR